MSSSSWIQLDTALFECTEVLSMADEFDCEPDALIGPLMRIWAYLDVHGRMDPEQPEDAVIEKMTVRMLQRAVRQSAAQIVPQLVKVGWLVEESAGLRFPNYARHAPKGCRRDRQEWGKKLRNSKGSTGRGTDRSTDRRQPVERAVTQDAAHERERECSRDLSKVSTTTFSDIQAPVGEAEAEAKAPPPRQPTGTSEQESSPAPPPGKQPTWQDVERFITGCFGRFSYLHQPAELRDALGPTLHQLCREVGIRTIADGGAWKTALQKAARARNLTPAKIRDMRRSPAREPPAKTA